MVQQVLLGILVVYGGSEIALSLALRARGNIVRGADRGSLAVLWTTITVAIFAALQVGNSRIGRLPGSPRMWAVAGAAVLLTGLAVRWTAILTLRGAFTVDVAIAKGQRLVERGIYRWLRHPAYTGNLLAFLGMGLVLGNWLAALILMVPITVAFLYRIQVEERALRDAFGEEYARYSSRTRRLIPFVY